MADPNEFDDVMPENTARRDARRPLDENLFTRLIYMIIVGVMLSFVGTVLGIVALIQFVLTLVNNKVPNDRLAEFGTTLGIWVAKAARYQAFASEEKPWPWTELD
ncbi:MAG: DUF4389 domain-containing protein [Salibaculum sp.]|uniref:DUF4389 domain-containing protein n=1 Tax=Salibaculum sp. TaxID=2855480 RepID=UPI002870A3D7|nr:DUF4389 domain-containing protein [Salibaculum sp.]MDR9426515.1 DUF4389 domain-containing protein [Salibaculum sp.]MDR9481176.1 DUF4389 domain-containing protein [Salibaculum sp.]